VVAAGSRNSCDGHPPCSGFPRRIVEVERISVGLSGAGRPSAFDRGQRPLEAAQRLAERCLDLHGSPRATGAAAAGRDASCPGPLRPGPRRTQTRFAALAPASCGTCAERLQTIAAGARERERRIEQLRFESRGNQRWPRRLQPGEDDGLRLEHARLSSTRARLEDLEARARTRLGQAPLGRRASSHQRHRCPAMTGQPPLARFRRYCWKATAADLARRPPELPGHDIRGPTRGGSRQSSRD